MSIQSEQDGYAERDTDLDDKPSSALNQAFNRMSGASNGPKVVRITPKMKKALKEGKSKDWEYGLEALQKKYGGREIVIDCGSLVLNKVELKGFHFSDLTVKNLLTPQCLFNKCGFNNFMLDNSNISTKKGSVQSALKRDATFSDCLFVECDMASEILKKWIKSMVSKHLIRLVSIGAEKYR